MFEELDSALKTNILYRNQLNDSETKNNILNFELCELRNKLNQAYDSKQILIFEIDKLKGNFFNFLIFECF